MFSMTSSVFDHSFHSFRHTFDQILAIFLQIFFTQTSFIAYINAMSLNKSDFPTLYFSCWPTTLDRIKVRNISWPLEKLYVLVIQKVLCNFEMVTRDAILRKYLTMVNVHVKF